MKTLVGETVFPKTTHTLLTAYYTSYINTDLPQTTDPIHNTLIRYYSKNNDSTPFFTISVSNSTTLSSQLFINIYNPDSSIKEYIVTESEPKVVIDLTADLAEASPGEKIADAQFPSVAYVFDN
jgi:hypothetical protein